MKCQNLFSRKNKKDITNLLSAELAERMVMFKVVSNRSGAVKKCFIIAPACSRVRYRRPIFRPSVRPSVRPPSVRLSTFMSTFDIYVKVSILINYKTKQPSNLA